MPPDLRPDLRLTLTRDPDLVAGALTLRRAVFVGEMGVRAEAEEDGLDAPCDHLILHDEARPDLGAVATLRLAEGCAGTMREFDLTSLRASGRALAEIGRVCLHRDYRGGLAAMLLFEGLRDVLHARGTEILLGAASFPGADPGRHMPALRRLRQEALAPADIRPMARGPGAIAVAGEAPRSAMRDVPALIKTYLRAGAWVGEGAYIDAGFDTVDVCVLIDLARAAPPRLVRPAGAADGTGSAR